MRSRARGGQWPDDSGSRSDERFGTDGGRCSGCIASNPATSKIPPGAGSVGVHVMQDQRCSEATIAHESATNPPGGHRPMLMPEESVMCAARLAAGLASAEAAV